MSILIIQGCTGKPRNSQHLFNENSPEKSNYLCMGNYNKNFIVPSGGDLLLVVHFLLRKIEWDR